MNSGIVLYDNITFRIFLKLKNRILNIHFLYTIVIINHSYCYRRDDYCYAPSAWFMPTLRATPLFIYVKPFYTFFYYTSFNFIYM